MTHKVYESASVRCTLHAHKARPHGRQGNVRRVWKLRGVEVIKPGAFLSDAPGERNVGDLKAVRHV